MSSDSLVLNYNKLAMDSLRLQNFSNAIDLLKKAQELLMRGLSISDSNKLWAITLNNLGCYYKKSGQLELALHYLLKALDISRHSQGDVTNLAGTHLNICAIKSQLGTHSSALKHATKAIKLLSNQNQKNLNTNTTLIIAYHNAGLEYQHLLRGAQATKVYKLGYKLASEHLKMGHPLTQSLKKSLQGVSEGRDIYTPRLQSKRSTRSARSEQCSTPTQYVLNSSVETIPRVSRTASKTKRYSVKPVNRSLNEDQTQKVRYLSGDRLKPMNREIRKTVRVSVRKTRTVKPLGNDQLMSELNSEIVARVNSKKGKRITNKSPQPVLEIDLKIAKAQHEAQAAMKELKLLQEQKQNLDSIVNIKRQETPVMKMNGLEVIPQCRIESKIDSIIVIQACVKSWIQRKKFVKQREAALKIQKTVRMWQTQRLYQGVRSAIIFIQYQYRRYRKYRSNQILQDIKYGILIC